MVLTAVAAAPAAGSPIDGTVLLAPACDDAPEVTQVLAWLSVELSQRNWTVASGIEPGNGGKRPCAVVARRRVQRRLANARGLFEEKLRHDAARLELEQALTEFHAAHSLLDAPVLYAKVRFYLGWIDFALGQRRTATEHFSAAARIPSAWKPDAGQFPPDVIERYAEVEALVRRTQRSRLAVVTRPLEAAVWLDGKKACTSPCALGALLAGEHFLEVKRSGYATARRRFALEPGGKKRLDVRLRPDRREALAALAEATGGEDPSSILKLAGTPAAILVAPGPTPSQVRVHAATSGARASRGRLNVSSEGSSQKLRPFLDRFVPAREAPAQAGLAKQPSGGDVRPTEAPGVLQRVAGLAEHWWFWAGIGGAAAAVAGAVAITASTDRDKDRLHVTVRP